MPLNSSVCRVCLSVNVRMSNIVDTPLQFVYEKLTDIALHSVEPRPLTACYVCCALLEKSHKLMLMAAGAENVLTEIFQRYPKTTKLSSLIGENAGLYASLYTAPTVHYTIGSDHTAAVDGPPALDPPVVELDDREFENDVKLEVQSDVENMISLHLIQRPPQSPFRGYSDKEIVWKPDNESRLKNLAAAQKYVAKMFAEAKISGDVTHDSEIKPTKQETKKEIKFPILTTDRIYPSKDPAIWTGRKYFECNECQSRFKKRDHIILHIRTHTGEKPYTCNICNHRCKQKSNLNTHIRTHTGEGTLSCTICPRKFRNKDNLVHHLRTHTGEKPHICSICNKGFNRKRSMLSHLRTHTGEKPYECRYCHRRFREYCSVRKHIRVHTGEAPYECNICEMSFKQKSILKKHLRIHTGEEPYQYDVCQKRFKQKGALNKHIRLHTGEKPYVCSVCGHKFKDQSKLVCHIRTHTGETPYECRFCKRRFKQNAHLKLHITRKHTD